jgi:hypothetical protein
VRGFGRALQPFAPPANHFLPIEVGPPQYFSLPDLKRSSANSSRRTCRPIPDDDPKITPRPPRQRARHISDVPVLSTIRRFLAGSQTQQPRHVVSRTGNDASWLETPHDG